jgi:hypothetical protein
MLAVSPLRHTFVKCRCGHDEHTADGLDRIETVRCAACEAAAERAGVVLSVISVDVAEAQAVAAGMRVTLRSRPHVIVDAVQVTKHGGAVVTPWVLLKLRAA